MELIKRNSFLELPEEAQKVVNEMRQRGYDKILEDCGNTTYAILFEKDDTRITVSGNNDDDKVVVEIIAPETDESYSMLLSEVCEGIKTLSIRNPKIARPNFVPWIDSIY